MERKYACVLLLRPSSILQFLPVYKPSEEEKNDPNLYADNVQRLMAKYVAAACVFEI